jgi:RNA polymerase sigma-70 factor (ECF subfamily)
VDLPDEPDADASLARRIMAAAGARDLAAEQELCRRLSPRIRLYGLGHLRDRASADDLVQEALMIILQRLRDGAVNEPDKVVSFVFGTCRQLVIDQRRGGARRARILSTFASDLAPAIVDQGPPIPERRLQKCLEQLAERERTVALMTFYDDSTAEEIARELGLSTGNVRIIRRRGVEKLRRCIEQHAGAV